jgi:hypothetical protein
MPLVCIKLPGKKQDLAICPLAMGVAPLAGIPVVPAVPLGREEV